MFRVEALYFRETAVIELQSLNSADIEPKALQKSLLFALESARTRLAVAIASEKKNTLPERWQSYLEMVDQMRHSIKRLRNAKIHGGAPYEWKCAFEMLRSLSGKETVDELCRILKAALSGIDK
jgi:hypothetical protein